MKELSIEFFRYDLGGWIEVHFTQESFDFFVKAIENMGIKVITKETTEPQFSNNRTREILKSVHEVQDLELTEGMDVLPGIESLVAKYSALK